VLFGVATVLSGSRVLFGSESARDAAGAYVPFVLWFNTLAGFFYVLAGVGLWRTRVWAARMALGIAAATALAYAAFGAHVVLGGSFERRTVVAMALRTVFWTAIAGMAGSRLGWKRKAI
jgi:hypothetical protein